MLLKVFVHLVNFLELIHVSKNSGLHLEVSYFHQLCQKVQETILAIPLAKAPRAN